MAVSTIDWHLISGHYATFGLLPGLLSSIIFLVFPPGAESNAQSAPQQLIPPEEQPVRSVGLKSEGPPGWLVQWASPVLLCSPYPTYLCFFPLWKKWPFLKVLVLCAEVSAWNTSHLFLELFYIILCVPVWKWINRNILFLKNTKPFLPMPAFCLCLWKKK